jgi:hypothetical protein
MASEALARSLVCCLTLAAAAASCREAPRVTATWRVEPTPPVVGTLTTVRLTLVDHNRQPLAGAKLRLEAHMAHPGMAPLTADVTEAAAGTYEARIALTMAGDWTFVMAGSRAGGDRIAETLAVPSVKPSS